MTGSVANSTDRRVPPSPREADDPASEAPPSETPVEAPQPRSIADTAYQAMAAEMVRAAGRSLAGLTALDADAGADTTSAVAAALTAAGADVVAHGPADHADGARLPFDDDSVEVTAGDVLLGAHADSRTRLAEMARVTRPGGLVLAVAYTEQPPEPTGAVVESVLARFGCEGVSLERSGNGRAATSAYAFGRLAEDAGLVEVRVLDRCAVARVSAHDVVDWRLGMPAVAPFMAGLSPHRREALRLAAWTALGAGKCLLQFPLLVMRAEVPG